MSELTQLILDTGGNSIVMPESRKGGYYPRKELLATEVQMISGRTVKEVRGEVWCISYQYGYFDNDTVAKVIESCEKGRKTPISCAFLPQEADGEMLLKTFFVTDYVRPKFQWSRIVRADGTANIIPVWADFSVELQEVEPSD
jgi:hypothetical protein